MFRQNVNITSKLKYSISNNVKGWLSGTLKFSFIMLIKSKYSKYHLHTKKKIHFLRQTNFGANGFQKINGNISHSNQN